MDVKEAIRIRKSIRQYESKAIPEDVVKELLDAARLAPSAKNKQSHKYFIIQDKETKDKLRENETCRQEFVYGAPLIIVCCADPSLYRNEDYALIDLSIATSFLTLRATELGLGSCYIGLIKGDKIKEVLKIPEKFILPYVITLGYPAEDPDRRAKKDLKEIVF